jgi:hypothetical protein
MKINYKDKKKKYSSLRNISLTQATTIKSLKMRLNKDTGGLQRLVKILMRPTLFGIHGRGTSILNISKIKELTILKSP